MCGVALRRLWLKERCSLCGAWLANKEWVCPADHVRCQQLLVKSLCLLILHVSTNPVIGLRTDSASQRLPAPPSASQRLPAPPSACTHPSCCATLLHFFPKIIRNFNKKLIQIRRVSSIEYRVSSIEYRTQFWYQRDAGIDPALDCYVSSATQEPCGTAAGGRLPTSIRLSFCADARYPRSTRYVVMTFCKYYFNSHNFFVFRIPQLENKNWEIEK